MRSDRRSVKTASLYWTTVYVETLDYKHAGNSFRINQDQKELLKSLSAVNCYVFDQYDSDKDEKKRVSVVDITGE